MLVLSPMVRGMVADKVVEWCLFAVAALLPIFIMPTDWAIVTQAKVMLLGTFLIIGLLAFVVARFMEGTLTLPKNLLFLTVAVLPIAYTLSAILAGFNIASFVGGSAEQDTVVIVVMFYTLFALTASTLMSITSARTGVMRAFILGAAALIIFQLIRLFMPALSLGGALAGSASSVVGGWHDLGIMAAFIVVFAAAFISTPIAQGFWKWLTAIVGVASFVLLFVVNTIDVWYTLAGISALFVIYELYVGRFHESIPVGAILRGAGVWIAIAIISLISGIWSPVIYSHMPASLQIAQVEVRPSWQGTFAIGEKVLSGKSDLIFGSGPNTFIKDWSLFKPAGVNATVFWNADFTRGVGIIPTAFVTVGILGIIAWLLPCLGILWSISKLLRSRMPYASPLRAYLAGIVACVIFLFAFIVMYVPGVVVVSLAFLFLGMLVAAESASTSAHIRLPVRGFSVTSLTGAVAMVLVVVILGGAAGTGLAATLSDLVLAHSVSQYRVTNDLQKAGAGVQQALTIFPQNDNAQRAAVELGLLKLSQLVAANKTDDAAKKELQTTLSETIQHGLDAVSINGGDYQNWLALAGLYQNLAGVGVQGAFENAKNAYQKAIAQNPTNPLIYVQVAQLEMAQNALNDAFTNLDKAILLKPDFPAAYYFRSQIEASQNDFVNAAKDAGQAAQLVPTDPLGWYNLGAVLYAGGDYPNAAASLSKSITLQNNYANAIYLLALTYAKMGRLEDATNAMQAVANLNPDNANVKDMIQQLQKEQQKQKSTTKPVSTH
jgi:tetratricopeptide (TPR) repeat protein